MYVIAPQCISTRAAIRRETGRARMTSVAVTYLFALAYGAAFLTYHTAVLFGTG